MNKILPIYFVMMFCSLATFGQNKFYFKSFPDSSGLFEPKPINPAIRISPDIRFAIPNLNPNGSFKSDNIPSFESDQLSAINRFRPQPDAEGQTTIFQEHSEMPIADLSIGYSSNFPIKEFPEDYPSNMPIQEFLKDNPSNMSIIDGKSSLPEALFKGLKEGDVILVE